MWTDPKLLILPLLCVPFVDQFKCQLDQYKGIRFSFSLLSFNRTFVFHQQVEHSKLSFVLDFSTAVLLCARLAQCKPRCKGCQETQWGSVTLLVRVTEPPTDQVVKTPVPSSLLISYLLFQSSWAQQLLIAASCSSSRPTKLLPAGITQGPARTPAQLAPAAVTQSLPADSTI